MDPCIGENEETRKFVVESYNDILYCLTQLHLRFMVYHWNTYGPRYIEQRMFWKCMIKKSAKLGCKIADRVRAKGGFTFGANDMRSSPCPVTEIDKLPDDKQHHLTEEDTLHVTVVQLEAMARFCKCRAEMACKKNAHADGAVMGLIATAFENGAQMARGQVTPPGTKPPILPPTKEQTR